MTQSIKMDNCVDHIDRISDLPGNVIDGILKHLNIRELVSTSILSTKWRKMWMSVRELDFGYDFVSRFEDLDNHDLEILRIISDVLLLHDGPIYKFSLETSPLSNLITTEYPNKWILFLSKRDIKLKDLQILDYDRIDNIIKMPSHIFSCEELTRFRCSGFNLSVPPNFCGLKKLVDLCLEHNTYEFGALENLVSGCPLLEKLSIILRGDMKPVCLKKAENLIDLRITLCKDCTSGLIKSLPKIQRLTIIEPFGEKLYTDIISPTQLISLKYLKLYGANLDERKEVLYVVSVLKSASDLVELDIKNQYCGGGSGGEQEPDRLEELECSSCCLSQLQTVNICVGANFKHAMSLTHCAVKHFTGLIMYETSISKRTR
ncbi:hypothetical protein TSUD_144820 [Trifolium subterraneum]|uniref:F-box domain-containing protein n=1 Tax=Trifolium subterraneum TaxID=3900 RepID=A0A2Z6MPB6_TRISU|nr:hypothetical protein TSUD_144820 [Trifolium subterraneum]